MRKRPPVDKVEEAVEQIRQTARMRSGMVAGLIFMALLQILPSVGHESFEALVRDMTPALILGCIALPAVAWVARRDERRVRRQRSALRLR